MRLRTKSGCVKEGWTPWQAGPVIPLECSHQHHAVLFYVAVETHDDDMSHLRTTIAILAAALLIIDGQCSEKICKKNGLVGDVESGCEQYYRCEGGRVRTTYRCPPGRAFSEASGACLPRERVACVALLCAPADRGAYPVPGTACRRYYRCRNGTATEYACPHPAWFDVSSQACAYGTGSCFEPICAGLVDGDHPDPSSECRRRIRCGGARLRSVFSCGGLCGDNCPAARSAALRLPVGDADLCGEAGCTAPCQGAADGTYADRERACREYTTCAGGRVVQRGTCEPGYAWASGRGCQPASSVTCDSPSRSACYGRRDGTYRDWRDCSSWLVCRRERVVFAGKCDLPNIFDGNSCVPPAFFHCELPRKSRDCEGRPSGDYQDPETNCSLYYHCEGGFATRLSCGAGRVFDGVECVSAERARTPCPSVDPESCWSRADGRYAMAASCRGFYTCTAGQKAVSACAPGLTFTGAGCERATCQRDAGRCHHLPDGYHADLTSGCLRYFYCDNGDFLATFTCRRGVFDGRACVETARHACTPPHPTAAPTPCTVDGFYPRPATRCKGYYICTNGEKTDLQCFGDKVFNGQVCVSPNRYECPEP